MSAHKAREEALERVKREAKQDACVVALIAATLLSKERVRPIVPSEAIQSALDLIQESEGALLAHLQSKLTP